MSIKRNIVATYVAQIYVTLIGMLVLPLYLRYMGAEAYGLVGFFTMLQAWFNLLDLGLTPTVARETARFSGGATDILSYRRLLRAIQIIFIFIAFLGGGLLLSLSGVIARDWLNTSGLSRAEVQFAIQLMAVGIAFRWASGFYRGCIAGAERLAWLSGFTAVIATLRFLGVFPVLIMVGNSPATFFIYQLIVGLAELSGLLIKSKKLIPVISSEQKLGWSFDELFSSVKPKLKFSLSIAFTSSVWVVVTQADKLALSKLLSLTDYGYFTLAVLAASGVMLVSGPISAVLMPRMANLHAQGDELGLIKIYRRATQVVAGIAVPACLILSLFPSQVLWVWTGDMRVVTQTSVVLSLYAIGNGFLVISAFPYYLQYAKGDLRLHLIGSVLFLVLLMPLLLWATVSYGLVGAGWAWVSANAMYFIFWTPAVHRKFFSNFHLRWLLCDLMAVILLPLVVSLVCFLFIDWPHERYFLGLSLVGVGILLTLVSTVGIFFLKNTPGYFGFMGKGS